jgi:hypothetical protein
MRQGATNQAGAAGGKIRVATAAAAMELVQRLG